MWIKYLPFLLKGFQINGGWHHGLYRAPNIQVKRDEKLRERQKCVPSMGSEMKRNPEPWGSRFFVPSDGLDEPMARLSAETRPARLR
ncbi:hypothetical protein GWI33_012063 [Rhynchophorus ferrugineus]|uniref:Uncharacterized protein n=1 Tax=Rhynchophorus ferrugineus TaxID=354439 RepID=A0A834IC16_RHYFE|nr:hypothetical protein GWI33_012063 [Rhynchophorus ferrugineus]